MSVTQDATSLKYIPQTSAEWTTLLTGSGIANPSALWRCQEAANNLVDSIGTFTLAKSGSPLYQQTVTGWTSKCLVASKGVSCGWTNSDAGLPDLSTASMMIFSWVVFPSLAGPGGTQYGISVGSTFEKQGVLCNPTASGGNAGKFGTAWGSGNTTDVSANAGYANRVTPFILQANHATSLIVMQTDLETASFTPNVFPASSKMLWLGGDNGAATNQAMGLGYIYTAAWFNTDAELDAGHRATLLNLVTNGPATGSGRLSGTSPLVSSSLIKSPLVN